MRVLAQVYDAYGTRTGPPVTAIKGASATEQLDGAGSFSLDVATDERVLDYLVNEAEARVQVQTYDDSRLEEWVRGVIRDNEITDQESGPKITVSGPDVLDQLTEETVGIGRSYNNQTLSTIINDLLSLKGWSASIDTSVASDLQASRFDGVNVLQALIRTVQEKGIHFRNGLVPNTIEVGVFGNNARDACGARVRAIRAPSIISAELQENTAVILIDRISRSSKSDDVVNWCIPIGAGEGSSALTLKDTTYIIYDETSGAVVSGYVPSTYPIYRRLNSAGIYEYYIDASAGARKRKAVVTFKEIGPVANELPAKQLAANALVQATTAYLERQRLPLVCYRLSAKNVQATIRAGDKIRVRYTGEVEIQDETRSTRPRLTYINVNEDMWVMKVTRRISEGGIGYDFEVSTIDRYAMDSTKIVVSMMQAMQARNLSVQTFPFMSERSSKDFVGMDVLRLQDRPAQFSLKIDEKVTDLVQVSIRFKTRPLTAQTRVQDSSVSPFLVVYEMIEGDQHPKGLQLWINGVDVSAAFGGPWNNRISGTPGIAWSAGQYENNALDVTCDITSYILNASGGIYRDHVIQFYSNADRNAFAYKVPGQGSNTNLTGDATSGEIECNFLIFGTARGVLPAPG